MKAPGLLEVGLRLSGGLDDVERSCLRGVEPEGVDMGAAQRRRLHDVRDLLRGQAQRPRRVADLVGRLPVDHRPLVPAEASERGRPRGRRFEQAERGANDLSGQRVGIHPGALGVDDVAAHGLKLPDIAGEHDRGPGVPARELGRSPGVVVEEEVVDRMAPPDPAALEPGLDPRRDACGVRGGALAPLALGELREPLACHRAPPTRPRGVPCRRIRVRAPPARRRRRARGLPGTPCASRPWPLPRPAAPR